MLHAINIIFCQLVEDNNNVFEFASSMSEFLCSVMKFVGISMGVLQLVWKLPSSTTIPAAVAKCERQSDAFHLEKVSVCQLATASGHNHLLVRAEKSMGVQFP